MILPLFGVPATEEDSNLDGRLRKLATAGYARRLPRENWRSEYVYALTAAGAEILMKHQLPLPFADWAEKNRAVKTLFIEHTLMVARAYVSLVVGLRELPDFAITTYERESRPRGQYALIRTWRGERGLLHKVNPDALFALEGPGIHPSAHFLEADQSTMQHSRMAEKFEDYAAMYREQRHPDLFAVPSFRVCVVTKSETRAMNLLKLLIEATDVQPDERRLFWFASEDAYRNYPANIFASIWRRADDPAQLRSLSRSPLPRRSAPFSNPQVAPVKNALQ